MFVEQYRAFATHGFGDEEMLADSQSRGMELVELQVGYLRPCTNRSGQAVASRHRGIRGVREQPSRATGGKNHTVRIDDTCLNTVLSVTNRQTHAGDMTVTHQHIVQERMFQHGDIRILPHHGGDVEFQDLSGSVSPSVHHAGTAMRGFESTQHMSFVVAIHMPSIADKLAYATRALVGQNVDCGAVAQPMTGSHSVGRMQRGRIVIENRSGHTALSVVCVRFDELILAYQQHFLRSVCAILRNRRASAGGQSFAAKTAISGCRERRAQSGDTRSDYDDHGCTSSMRCNAILASRAVSSSTVMRLTILPCSMFSNAHARYAG